METIIYTGKEDYLLYIMRGLPGSGKSTLAKQIGGMIFSTDDFFMKNGIYQFDRSKIGIAHLWNRRRTKNTLRKKAPKVVVDNTNIRAREIEPYARYGVENNYTILLAEPETPHKWDVKKLAQINSHQVPEEVIQRMKNNYEKDLTLEKILGAG